MELVDDRGLPDAGISGYEHELRRAASDHPLERSAQAADLPLPPTQPLRDREAVRGIMRSDRERVDPTLRLPFVRQRWRSARSASRLWKLCTSRPSSAYIWGT